jgi:hypothetical protein
MADALSDAPSWVTSFRETLIEQKFARVQERRYDQPFDNYVAEFARSDFHVQSVKDRGDWRIDVWDAIRPTNEGGQPLHTSISMIRAVQDGIEDEAEAVRHPVEDEADWMIEHLDATERLVMDRATWKTLDAFTRQYRQRVFGG